MAVCDSKRMKGRGTNLFPLTLGTSKWEVQSLSTGAVSGVVDHTPAELKFEAAFQGELLAIAAAKEG